MAVVFPGLGWPVVAALILWRGLCVLQGERGDPHDTENAEACNNPPTGYGFTNSRGILLHVRHALPINACVEPCNIKAAVLLLHGLGAHTNRQKYAELASGLAKRGIFCIMYDQEGHGRSGGLQGYIADTSLLVDDAQQIIELMTNVEDEDGAQPLEVRRRLKAEQRLGLPLAVRKRIKSVPLVLMGQSMGGSIAILLGLRLQSKAWPNFCGCALLCPALVAELPPLPVLYFLTFVIAPLFRKARMPRVLDATCAHENIWKRKEDIERIQADTRPGGLSSGAPMRYGTAVALLSMLADIQLGLPRVKFPLVVLHDSEDKVCKFEGSERMMRQVKTQHSDKSLIEMPGMLHDLITNATEEVTSIVGSWVTKQATQSCM